MSRTPAWPVVRILVLGDSDAGKTRLVQAITAPINQPVNFQQPIHSTVGCAPMTVIHSSRSSSTNVFIEFFDIGGHRKWRDSRPVWYRDYTACMFVFDLTNARSYQHLPQWIDELTQASKRDGLKDMPAICIGTKLDLVHSSTDRAYDPMRDFGLELIKTSMKTASINTIETFIERAIKQIVNPPQSSSSFDSMISPAHQRRGRASQDRLRTPWDDDNNDSNCLTISIDDFERINSSNNNHDDHTYASVNNSTNQLLAFSQSQSSSRSDSMFGRLLPSMRTNKSAQSIV